MNRHDDAEQRVSAWLHDEAQGELPDWVLQETFERTRETPQQRGLRGWLAVLTHSTRATAQGRTLMLTVPKLSAVVAATALVTTAIVGISLAPAAEVQVPGAETTARSFVEFSGKTRFGDCFGDELARETSPGFVRETNAVGHYCVNPIAEDFGDPRLGGEFRVWTGGNDGYGLGPTIWSSRFSMHDDAGAWVQRPSLTLSHADGSGPNEVVVMDGRGAYEGLSVIAEVHLFDNVWTWSGYVIEGDLPPVPEVVLPE